MAGRTADAEYRALLAATPDGAVPASGPKDAPVVLVVTPSARAGLEEDAVEALAKGLAALGADMTQVRIVPTKHAGQAPAVGWGRLLAWEVEIVDPLLVLVSGEDASAVAREAWPGEPLSAMGRPVHLIPDPASSLREDEGKRALWTALKAIGSSLAEAAPLGDGTSSSAADPSPR